MKRLSAIAISFLFLVALAGVAHATDYPTKQEGRIWYDQNLTLAFTPKWSLTAMPGARLEYARAREDYQGFQFIEFFFGPNYTYKWKDFTFKGSLWYYYMGYPQRGRMKEDLKNLGHTKCSPTDCTPTYNFSHNLEIIPTAEYRRGRWSFYDRVIFHNTFYADVYNNTNPATNAGLDVGSQRAGWGTVLRELAQARYALTDRLGLLLADELFFGIIEDSDSKKLTQVYIEPASPGAGYNPYGYWKAGFRQNRTYLGIDFKVTPVLTVSPMYMLEVDVDRLDSADVTDMSHNLFIVVTYVAKMYEDKK
jgi:hypothetical protein